MSLTVARDTLERAPLPGDVFLLNWPRLGIDQMVVRVTGIDTGTLGSSEWRIEAMEDVFGLDNAVLAPPPPIIDEPTLEPLPPAQIVAVEIPYWELARTLSRAELDYLTDTDAAVGALAAAGGVGQLNWQLATGASAGEIASVASEDYAPLFTLDAALPASEADAIGLPVTAISQPERLTVGDYAYLVDGSGEIRESVAVLRSSRTCSSCAARTLTICSTGLPNAEPSVALPCLAHLRLENGSAAKDIRELRDLLEAWRDARRTAWQTTIKVVTTGILAALLVGAAIKLKLMGGVQ